MRIVFIGQKGIPAKDGGVEKQVERLALSLRFLNQEIIIYNRKNYWPENKNEFKGIKIISKPFINSKNLASISHNFLATIDACFRKVDIIHFHGVGPALLIFIVKLFKPKVKVIATLHSYDYDNNKWGRFAKLMLKLGEKSMVKWADKVIVLSLFTKNYLQEKYKKDAIVIPNGVELEDYPGNDCLKNWNLTKDSYILSVSRIIELKGIQYLIKAFKNIKTDKKLVIVGEGDYKQELESLAAGDERIIFTNNQSGNNLKQLFANAYLFTQTSKMEGLSISLLEAMSHGLPCLVSNIEANLEVSANLAYSFKSQDSKSLEDELNKLLMIDKVELKNSGEKLKERIAENYQSLEIAKETLNLYKSLLN
jgi:glycosyltransferase involved in cell wall biosynthesis